MSGADQAFWEECAREMSDKALATAIQLMGESNPVGKFLKKQLEARKKQS